MVGKNRARFISVFFPKAVGSALIQRSMWAQSCLGGINCEKGLMLDAEHERIILNQASYSSILCHGT